MIKEKNKIIHVPNDVYRWSALGTELSRLEFLSSLRIDSSLSKVGEPKVIKKLF